MKVIVQGKGPVDLTQNDFLGSGGEGQIYVKGTTAYKIYLDTKKMIPLGKIQELSKITDRNVIRPESIVLDSKQTKPVGYTMRYVNDTYALCQLFTKTFREKNKISPQMSLGFVRSLQTIVNNIHAAKILVVDLNELNFLITHDFKSIVAIDTDSYQTPSFPATAIMDTIRDRHTKIFSELTDWFSFAILAFQLMVGIHPYKGKHDQYKTLEERMINNVSVLNHSVRVPGACYPFSVIPQVYLDWFGAVLDKGQRIAPPIDLQAIVKLVTKIQKIVGSDNFEIEELLRFDEKIEKIIFLPGDLHVVATTNKLYCGKREINKSSQYDGLVTTPNGLVVSANVESKKLILRNESATNTIIIDMSAEWIVTYDNRLYIKNGHNILEINLLETSHKDIMATAKIVAKVLPSATMPYDGVVIQDVLGMYYASMFPHSSHHQCIKLPELTGYRIVRARYSKRVLMIIAAKNGIYDRFVFRIENDDYDAQYDLNIINDIDPLGLNFVVLDSGVVVMINEDEKLEMFSAKKDGTFRAMIDDPNINFDMTLMVNGKRLYFTTYADPGKLFSITMKKKS